MAEKKSIAVIGQGRFGKFWAKELSRVTKIFVYDVDDKKLTDVSSFAVAVDLDEALTKDYIVLTIPIREIKNFITQNRLKISNGSVLIDSASVKSVVVEWFDELLPEGTQYIFSHPLFGPDSGSKGLNGLSITLFPGKIDYQKYKDFVNLTEQLGLNVLTLTPEEHDYQMAFNLNLIHLLGRSLAKMNIGSISLKMNALTYLNRMSDYVINDSPILFQDFFAFNPYAKKITTQFLANVKSVIDELPNIKGEDDG